MSLSGWTGPVNAEGWRFGEPATPLTLAERIERLTDAELVDAIHDRLPAAIDTWRYGGPEASGRAGALLRSLAGVKMPAEVWSRSPQRFRVAFLGPGPLPDGWVRGAPPPMSVEEWSRWAKAEARRLEE